MQKKYTLKTVLTMAAIFVLGSLPAAAQTEVSGIWGASFGLPDLSGVITDAVGLGLSIGGAPGATTSTSNTSGSKWVAGGGVAKAVSEHVLITGDVVYNRLISTTIDVSIPGAGSTAIHLTDGFLMMTGGAQYQFGESGSKLRPYVAGAGGIAMELASASAPSVGTVRTTASHLTFEAGGGARLFLGEKWGLRPDFRWVHVPGINFTRATAAVFVQF